MSRQRSGLTTLVAVLLFAVTVVLVLSSQRNVGIARDEATYIHYGKRYAEWWTRLASGQVGLASKDGITSYFGGPRATDGNREHPPLAKTLIGVSERVVHRGLGVSELTAVRLPTALLFGALVVMVYLFGRKHFGAVAGAVAAGLVLLMPRLFFHAPLATFDAPVVTMWFATLFFYDRALHSEKSPWPVALIFGLALATKHNALMLPAVLGLHYLWVVHRDVRGGRGNLAERGATYLRGIWNLKPSLALALLVGGPVVLIAVWPWLWFDTFSHLAQWISFHLDHVHYNFEYLGENLNAPPFPWHSSLVTTAFTVPVVTLVASAMGVGDTILRYRQGDKDEDAPAMLLGLSALVAIGPFLLSTTPIFGAEKHYAAVVPTLCIFAGVGVRVAGQLAARALSRVDLEQAATAAIAVLALAASGVETRAAQPYGLSYYNSLAGGAVGGAELGMNRQFWGYAARGVLPELERLAPKTGTVAVYTHDAQPAWPLYHRYGLVDRRLVDSGREEQGVRRSHLALVIHEKHFNRHDYMIWAAYETVQPVFVLTAGGVPIVSVYQRPSKAER
jgi:hypothetical protein